MSNMWKGKKSNGIMSKDGEINFSKLEQQIDQSVASDKTYWIQNEAKIRAVTNKVASYDEFCDIVKASHLKPLEKGDRISDIKVFNQPWNIAVNKGAGASGKTAQLQCTAIDNINQFNRAWKTHKSSEEKYTLLSSIPLETIQKIFKPEIGMGLLGEMLVALRAGYQAGHMEGVLDMLIVLTKSGRFELSLRFLSTKELASLSELLSVVLAEGGEWSLTSENSPVARVEQIKQAYGLTS